MSKYYTLEEAFNKRLLLYADKVDGTALYQPTKVFLKEGGYDRFFYQSSLYDYIDKDALKNAGIFRKDGQIFMNVRGHIRSKEAEIVKKIADKYFSIPEYNITATYTRGGDSWGNFYIYLDPKILVYFNSKEYPILELPSHTAYTC